MNEVTVGIGGAAGDGIDKSGDTLAKSCSRSGLYAYAFNSYQSVIRGGHIWLKLRVGEGKVESQGDSLNALIALNQDSIERHAPNSAAVSGAASNQCREIPRPVSIGLIEPTIAHAHRPGRQ